MERRIHPAGKISAFAFRAFPPRSEPFRTLPNLKLFLQPPEPLLCHFWLAFPGDDPPTTDSYGGLWRVMEGYGGYGSIFASSRVEDGPTGNRRLRNVGGRFW